MTHKLLKLARDVAELALLQLGLPEHRISIREAVLDPAVLLDVVQVDETTGVGVTMRSCQDTSSTELKSIVHAQFVVVLGVQDTIRKGLTRADAEQVASQTSTVAVDIVQRRSFLLGDSSAHGAHAEAHALVAVDEIGEYLAGSRDADATLVTELVQTALHAQPRQPVLAIGGATGHCAQQHAVDFNHLLDCLRGNPVAGCGSGIGCNDDAALESERQCRRAVGNLDRAVWV